MPEKLLLFNYVKRNSMRADAKLDRRRFITVAFHQKLQQSDFVGRKCVFRALRRLDLPEDVEHPPCHFRRHRGTVDYF
jgi:hypothetical protein